jgi:hypothetical protein
MKSRPGRPLSAAAKAKRENDKLWGENRPDYAFSSSSSDFFKHLVSGEAFKSVRNGLGLSHKTIPDALVFDVLEAMEGAAEEFCKKTNAAVDEKKAAIRSHTKAGGRKLPPTNLREAITGNSEGLTALNKFFLGTVSYKVLHNRLSALGLPVPDDRTLRRWRNQKIGH